MKTRFAPIVFLVCLSLCATHSTRATSQVTHPEPRQSEDLQDHRDIQPGSRQLRMAAPDSSNVGTSATDDHITQIVGSATSARGHVKNLTVLRRSGGRLDWSPKGDLIAMDRKGDDGYYDVYLVSTDGSSETCLTCETNGALSHGHHGQPAWHPSGNSVVFQSQKKDFTGGWGRDLSATPGFGQLCDLWLVDVRTHRFYQLTHTEDTKSTGVLHPHFSHDGTKLTWSQMYEKTGFLGTGVGNWKLKVADFSFHNGTPRLTRILDFEPGGPSFYENHGMSPDDRKLLFTGSFDGGENFFQSTRIFQYDLHLKTLEKLTHSPTWHEHALFNPGNGRIFWMTGKENTTRGTDYWSMKADGSDKTRISDFNNPDLPTFRGKVIVAADSSFSPDGRKLVAYLQTDLVTQDGLVVMIEPGEPDEGATTDVPEPLGEPITMNSGVYNPWTDRCSDKAAPVRRPMYVRQPSAPGEYPVFLFLIGTLRTHDSPTARAIVDRAASRGFVAAAVDYDTIASVFGQDDNCESLDAKSRCSLSSNDQAAPESALHLICNNVKINGRSAGLYADCDKGIVLAGFSQGAALAMMARNHEGRARAVWAMGFHNQAFPDKNPLQCLHGKDGLPAGPRILPSNRLRVVVGEGDTVLRRPHQPHLQAVTGRTCAPGTQSCFAEDGSGWAVVPNSECERKCKHEYHDTDGFLEPSSWWGVEKSLDWLERFVRGQEERRELKFEED